jgi:predicted nucleic acid-binding protein
MKVYLDTCSLHRPLDDKAQVRIALEAEAVLAVLTLCEAGAITLISSAVLLFEVERNPHPQRKAFVSEVLARATIVVELTDPITQRAKELERRGFKALDALHLASAEAGGIDYFCTCDDRLLKKAKAQTDLAISVFSPLELAQEITR